MCNFFQDIHCILLSTFFECSKVEDLLEKVKEEPFEKSETAENSNPTVKSEKSETITSDPLTADTPTTEETVSNEETLSEDRTLSAETLTSGSEMLSVEAVLGEELSKEFIITEEIFEEKISTVNGIAMPNDTVDKVKNIKIETDSDLPVSEIKEVKFEA